MSAADGPERDGLPMGVGRFGVRWLLACALLAAVAAFGAYGYAQQRLHGDVVTGLRTIGAGGPAWGVYICLDIVLVGLAFAGIALTTLTRLFRIHALWPLTRMGELLAVVSLMMAGLCVVADLGRPWHGLLYLPRYARTASPFFGTFTLVIGAGLSASLVYVFLDGRADAAWCADRAGRGRSLQRLAACGFRNSAHEHWRHRQVSFWLSMALLPLLVVAYSTLGFVFGIQGGRPGWFSALQAPGFVALAALSGTGVLLGIAGAARALLHLDEAIPRRVFTWLGVALGIEIAVVLYFIAVEELTARYAAPRAQGELAEAIARGPYSWLFWSVLLSLIVPLAWIFERASRRKLTPCVAVTAGLTVQVAAVLERYLIVVPSQTHGTLLPWPAGAYAPTWVELSVVAGLLALGALLYLVGLKIYPIVPLQSLGILEPRAVASEPSGRRTARRILFSGTLLAGSALAVAGLLLSARVGTLGYRDPLVPFSPVIFIAGLVLIFLSAVVYEMLPWTRAGDGAGG